MGNMLAAMKGIFGFPILVVFDEKNWVVVFDMDFYTRYKFRGTRFHHYFTRCHLMFSVLQISGHKEKGDL